MITGKLKHHPLWTWIRLKEIDIPNQSDVRSHADQLLWISSRQLSLAYDLHGPVSPPYNIWVCGWWELKDAFLEGSLSKDGIGHQSFPGGLWFDSVLGDGGTVKSINQLSHSRHRRLGLLMTQQEPRAHQHTFWQSRPSSLLHSPPVNIGLCPLQAACFEAQFRHKRARKWGSFCSVLLVLLSFLLA